MADIPGITQIVWVDSLGGSPARVNRKTGVMYLSRRDMYPLPKEIRLFIMLHEMGHAVLQTKSEEEADEWAFNEYAKRGYSLTMAVRALTRVLHDTNPAHAWRMYLQVQRAKKFDFEVNHNIKVYQNG
ncbi:MAG: hypothetical protein ACXVJE_19545 [Mucilaginibacter sp.]